MEPKRATLRLVAAAAQWLAPMVLLVGLNGHVPKPDGPTPVPTATRTETPIPAWRLSDILTPPAFDNDADVYDGYQWWGGGWVPGYISLDSWFMPSPPYTVGSATYYAPYIMEATAAARGLSLARYRGGISLMSPADIGKTVWIRRDGTGVWEGPYLDVDCARRGDIWPIVYYRHEVVEVDFNTAVRWGLAEWGGSGGWTPTHYVEPNVEVWVGDRPEHHDLYPLLDYRGWWLSRARFSTRAEDLVRTRPIGKSKACWIWYDKRVLCGDDFYREPWVHPEDYAPYPMRPIKDDIVTQARHGP